MLLRITALIVLAVSASFLHYAVSPILEQNRKVRAWPAVDATVTARYLDRTPRRGGGPRAGQWPVVDLQVEYRHEVAGVIYRKVQPNPRTEEVAPAGPKLIADREASYTRRGHYDPAKPAELFFPKPYGVSDYWLIFFWSPVLALGFGALVLRKPGRSLSTVAEPAGKGWHRLPPKYSIRHRMSGAWGVAVVCNALIGWAAFDYLTGEPRTRTTASSMLVGVALLPGLATAALAVYYTWMARRVADARVWVDAPRATPGHRLAAKFELPVKADVDLEHVVVSLACVRSEFRGLQTRFSERVVWEQRFERSLGSRRRTAAGSRVEFEQRFDVPPDAHPSFAGGVAGPWIDWEIRVEFHLDDGPDYRGKFPMVMEVERLAKRERSPSE